MNSGAPAGLEVPAPHVTMLSSFCVSSWALSRQ